MESESLAEVMLANAKAAECAREELLLTNTVLPRAGLNRRVVEDLGFVCGEATADIFVEVSFPAGWVVRSDGNLKFSLLDDKGRRRASMVHDPKFYDERAYLRFLARYALWDRKFSFERPSFSEGVQVRRHGVIDRGDGEDKVVFSSERKSECKAFLSQFDNWSHVVKSWS